MGLETNKSKIEDLIILTNDRDIGRGSSPRNKVTHPNQLFKRDTKFYTIESKALITAFSVDTDGDGKLFCRYSFASSAIRPTVAEIEDSIRVGFGEIVRVHGRMPLQCIVSDRCPWIQEFPEDNYSIVNDCIKAQNTVHPRSMVRLDPPEDIFLYMENFGATHLGLVYAHTNPLRATHTIVPAPPDSEIKREPPA